VAEQETAEVLLVSAWHL